MYRKVRGTKAGFIIEAELKDEADESLRFN